MSRGFTRSLAPIRRPSAVSLKWYQSPWGMNFYYNFGTRGLRYAYRCGAGVLFLSFILTLIGINKFKLLFVSFMMATFWPPSSLMSCCLSSSGSKWNVSQIALTKKLKNKTRHGIEHSKGILINKLATFERFRRISLGLWSMMNWWSKEIWFVKKENKRWEMYGWVYLHFWSSASCCKSSVLIGGISDGS